MKHLTVTYGNLTLFDGDIEELVFTDNDQGVTVQGRLRRAASNNGSGALMQLLASATKQSPAPTQEDNSDG